ncbi:MAG: sigma-54-dependent Fis family transcriptional regulator [Fimbriimonadaceae bacterium]|nr:sigma-54-dependent Fis family transcriptional regulator [Chitinophagales bacterium]
MNNRILIIDDDVDICNLLSRFLTKHGFETDTSNSVKTGIELVAKNNYDVVFCDFRLGDGDGRQVLQKIKSISPETQIIIITGYSDIKIAVDVMKMGAFDYITKPLLPDELLMITKKAIAKHDEVPDNNVENKKNGSVENKKSLSKEKKFLEGVSNVAKEVYRQIDLVAPTPCSVIIYGESGTGKESIARRIHEKSNRLYKPFVPVDCGALSKELAASELFGHIKGSFTGAIQDKTGHFEMANGGTLFLDEVTNLSYDVQVLLLRVVQERKLRKVGSNKETDVDVRIIIASNERLTEAVARGRFREDLYHRFNEFTIEVPALRNRGKDILLFANHFLNQANNELNKNVNHFSSEVIEKFEQYNWPGNLREMNNVIKRAVLLCEQDTIQLHDLPSEIVYHGKFEMLEDNYQSVITRQETKTSDLKSAAHQAEYLKIVEVLQKVRYNRTKAAQILNIDRKTLYLKMKLFKMLEE